MVNYKLEIQPENKESILELTTKEATVRGLQ